MKFLLKLATLVFSVCVMLLLIPMIIVGKMAWDLQDDVWRKY